MSISKSQGFLLWLTLAACTQAPDAAKNDIAYYRSHRAEREAMVGSCANDLASSHDSPACLNAREAARLEDVGSSRNLPPMGLPSNPGSKSDGASSR